jgi:tRNA(fMet)-specific endonuclease VapC
MARCGWPPGIASDDAMDKLIASHTLSLGLTLVTNNVADFAVYPGLAIENWVE